MPWLAPSGLPDVDNFHLFFDERIVVFIAAAIASLTYLGLFNRICWSLFHRFPVSARIIYFLAALCSCYILFAIAYYLDNAAKDSSFAQAVRSSAISAIVVSMTAFVLSMRPSPKASSAASRVWSWSGDNVGRAGSPQPQQEGSLNQQRQGSQNTSLIQSHEPSLAHAGKPLSPLSHHRQHHQNDAQERHSHPHSVMWIGFPVFLLGLLLQGFGMYGLPAAFDCLFRRDLLQTIGIAGFFYHVCSINVAVLWDSFVSPTLPFSSTSMASPWRLTWLTTAGATIALYTILVVIFLGGALGISVAFLVEDVQREDQTGGSFACAIACFVANLLFISFVFAMVLNEVRDTYAEARRIEKQSSFVPLAHKVSTRSDALGDTAIDFYWDNTGQPLSSSPGQGQAYGRVPADISQHFDSLLEESDTDSPAAGATPSSDRKPVGANVVGYNLHQRPPSPPPVPPARPSLGQVSDAEVSQQRNAPLPPPDGWPNLSPDRNRRGHFQPFAVDSSRRQKDSTDGRTATLKHEYEEPMVPPDLPPLPSEETRQLSFRRAIERKRKASGQSDADSSSPIVSSSSRTSDANGSSYDHENLRRMSDMIRQVQVEEAATTAGQGTAAAENEADRSDRGTAKPGSSSSKLGNLVMALSKFMDAGRRTSNENWLEEEFEDDDWDEDAPATRSASMDVLDTQLMTTTFAVVLRGPGLSRDSIEQHLQEQEPTWGRSLANRLAQYLGLPPRCVAVSVSPAVSIVGYLVKVVIEAGESLTPSANDVGSFLLKTEFSNWHDGLVADSTIVS